MSFSCTSSVSPSVYIGFTDLHAVDLCSTVGRNIGLTTMAFDPTELSSLAPPLTLTGSQFPGGRILSLQPPRQITFADLVQNWYWLLSHACHWS
jgi:hypothetical protein